MLKEAGKRVIYTVKQYVTDTFNLLWNFKWYITPYILFYGILLSHYLMPSPKNYFLWNNEIWYSYNQNIYLAVTKLMLFVFALIFFVGTSNIRNHPLLAKFIFLSSLFFGAVFLEII